MGPQPEVAAVRRAVRVALADLGRGELVLVACSGGADSTALAAALAFAAPRAGLRAGGLTVDHGLQPGSTTRAAEVADRLAGLGLVPVQVLTAEPPAPRPASGGPEAAARTARYRALDAAADRLGASVLLLGHSRDDQAETVLLGLARGSGARSLAGMAPVRGRYRRPLLGLSREVVRAAAAGLATWEDPHNADPAYRRSRVRHAALPVLEQTLGPGVAAALARTAELLRVDADALDGWATDVLAQVRRDPQSGGHLGPHVAVALDLVALAVAPEAVRTRVLRRAAGEAGAPASDLTARHVRELDRLLTGWHGQGPLHLPGRVAAARTCGTLTLSRTCP